MSDGKMNVVTSGDGIIQFELDDEMLKVIQNALGQLKGESNRVLKNAVNATARQAKSALGKKAKETYIVQQSRFTKAMKTQNATVANPSATINVTGQQLELGDFKVSPKAVTYGKNRPDVLRAKVLLASSLKPLEASTKAFMARARNGKVFVAQRKTKARYPIKKLLSNSIPVMVGSEDKVYGVVEPDIYDNLMDNILNEIKRILK